ncbi:tetratricopeptide repeat protein, partial [Candidatus Sumerlaeota bacterium]|nr:tetratricopeptide repeat protein [Candidatus Sumerlaeota bacterium]
LQLGKILESANKVESAFKIYRQTLIANPENKQAQFYFALAARKLKGKDGALQAFKDLAEEFPDNPEIQLIYARQLLNNDKLTEAEEVLNRIIELTPGNASALVSLGELALKQGNPEQAEHYFQKAVSLKPRDVDLYSQIAKILTDNKMLESAAQYLEKALKIQPERTEIFLSLFETYYKQDQLDKAEAITKRIIEHSKNKAELYSLLGTLYRVQGKVDEAIAVYNKSISLNTDELDTYIKLISLYLQTEQFHKAKQTINQAKKVFLKQNPTDLYYNLAVVYAQWGFFDDAINYIETLLNIKPEYLPAYSELAHIYNVKRDYEKAVEVFQRARKHLADKAESVEFYIREANALIEQYNYARAIKPLKKAINKDPSNITPYREVIILYTEWQKYSEAMTYINLAKQKFGSDNPEILTLEAEMYSSQHQFEKAQAIIENLLEQNPEDVDTLYSLGGIYYEAGEYDKAVETFNKILSIDPNNVDTLNSIGYTLAIQGKDLEKAERYIRKALNAKPYAGYILDSLGWVYFQRGDYAKARELIERANRLSLEDVEILQHLGDIYMKLGDTHRAIKFWSRALEIKPNQKEIEKRLKSVKL